MITMKNPMTKDAWKIVGICLVCLVMGGIFGYYGKASEKSTLRGVFDNDEGHYVYFTHSNSAYSCYQIMDENFVPSDTFDVNPNETVVCYQVKVKSDDNS